MPKKPREIYLGIIDLDLNIKNFPNSKKAETVKDILFKPELIEDSHGDMVLNLMSGNFPVGVATNGILSKASQKNDIEYLLKNEVPEVFVNSIYPQGESYQSVKLKKDFYKKISEKSTIVVSIGNDFPQKPLVDFETSSAIFVGNIDSNGLMSYTSQESEKISISAPAGNHIDSINEKGNITRFSGTSAAAPLVAGTISLIKGYLKDISDEELKIILKVSAIPTIAFSDSNNRNGAGALNTYLALRIAEKLSGEWPSNRNELYNFDTSNFVEESNNDFAQALQFFKQKNISCENLSKGIKKLRKAYFLNPKNNLIRKKLGEIYQMQGFDDEANYYGNSLPSIMNHPYQEPRMRDFLSGLVRGHANSIERGIKDGFDINIKYGTEYSPKLTPLDWAVKSNSPEAISLLILKYKARITDLTLNLLALNIESEAKAEDLILILNNIKNSSASNIDLLKFKESINKIKIRNNLNNSIVQKCDAVLKYLKD